jgi:hypothetical protein
MSLFALTLIRLIRPLHVSSLIAMGLRANTAEALRAQAGDRLHTKEPQKYTSLVRTRQSTVGDRLQASSKPAFSVR